MSIAEGLPCALTLLVGRQEGHLTRKTLSVGLLVVTLLLDLAHLIVPVDATTYITYSSNEIQNGDILAPASPGSPGKWPSKRTENISIAEV